MTRPLAVAAAAALSLSAAACSKQATIRLVDGSTHDRTIAGGTVTYLHVEHEDGMQRIRRDEIEHIGHPGRAATIIGGLVTGLGLGFLTVGLATHEPCDREAPACSLGHFLFTIPGATVAAGGLGPLIWGATTWGESARAARPPESDR